MGPSPKPAARSAPEPRLGRGTQAALLVTLVVLGSLAGVALLEGTMALLMAHPPSSSVLAAARLYYYFWERRLIQFLPECSQYDAELTYTLKPGGCRFRNREFAIDVRTDAAGFRSDAEQPAPAMLVLGDSYALGWGVPQDSTLASLLERRTGLPTLSTAMASYGTAREVLTLRRVNLSAAKYLIVQYCSNDFVENRDFVTAGGRLETLSRRAYDSLVADHRRVTSYYPGKYLRRLLPLLRDAWLGHAVPLGSTTQRDFPREAQMFVRVLLLSPAKMDRLQILVFDMEPLVGSGPSFAAALREELRRPGYPPWVRRIAVLDVSARLTREDYFVYDDHLRGPGFVKIADLLVPEITPSRTASPHREP